MSDIQVNKNSKLLTNVIEEIVTKLDRIACDIMTLYDNFTASQRDMPKNQDIAANDELRKKLNEFFDGMFPHVEKLLNNSLYLLSIINIYYNKKYAEKGYNSEFIDDMLKSIIVLGGEKQFEELILSIDHFLLQTLKGLSFNILALVENKKLTKSLSKYLTEYISRSYDSANRLITSASYIIPLLKRLREAITGNDAYVTALSDIIGQIDVWHKLGSKFPAKVEIKYSRLTLSLSENIDDNSPSATDRATTSSTVSTPPKASTSPRQVPPMHKNVPLPTPPSNSPVINGSNQQIPHSLSPRIVTASSSAKPLVANAVANASVTANAPSRTPPSDPQRSRSSNNSPVNGSNQQTSRSNVQMSPRTQRSFTTTNTTSQRPLANSAAIPSKPIKSNQEGKANNAQEEVTQSNTRAVFERGIKIFNH